MTLANVRDWLQSLGLADRFYIGKLDQKHEKSIGVYDNTKENKSNVIAIGGYGNTKTQCKPVSLLLHWNKNMNETEKAAKKLFKTIAGQALGADIGGYHASYIKITSPGAVYVGTDANGVYEYVLNLEIYYQEV